MRRVRRAALTNTPNLPQLTTLHSRQGADLTALEMEICRRMGLDPASFAAHQAMTARETAVRAGSLHTLGNGYLTQQEIDICKMLGVDPAR